MKKILLMRHAQAASGGPNLPDHDRSLTLQGKSTAHQMGEFLKQHEVVPGMIISSTAIRATETAASFLEALGHRTEITRTRQLYLADPEIYLNLLRDLPDEIEQPMLVGHNPGISNFLEFTCRAHAPMTTATIAEIHIDIPHWENLEDHTLGKLNNLWNPMNIN